MGQSRFMVKASGKPARLDPKTKKSPGKKETWEGGAARVVGVSTRSRTSPRSRVRSHAASRVTCATEARVTSANRDGAVGRGGLQGEGGWTRRPALDRRGAATRCPRIMATWGVLNARATLRVPCLMTR
jgi:hypothetical protein